MSETKIVRTNLFACLRESAQIWYIEELSDFEKKTLRTLDERANHWCNVLLKKFKKSMTFVLNYLIIERYTLNDVRVNRDISTSANPETAGENDFRGRCFWYHFAAAAVKCLSCRPFCRFRGQIFELSAYQLRRSWRFFHTWNFLAVNFKNIKIFNPAVTFLH